MDQEDSNGRTPLSWACGEGFIEVVKLLLATKRVSVTKKDRFKQSPRDRASSAFNQDVIDLLISDEKAQKTPIQRLKDPEGNNFDELLLRKLRNWSETSSTRSSLDLDILSEPMPVVRSDNDMTESCCKGCGEVVTCSRNHRDEI